MYRYIIHTYIGICRMIDYILFLSDKHEVKLKRTGEMGKKSFLIIGK